MAKQDYNANPHKPARVAMTLFNAEYAAQRGGSIDFWRNLSENKKRICREITEEIVNAPDEQK